MAGSDILHAASLSPKVLYSGQLADTAAHQLYTPPANGAAIVKHAVACNPTGSSVTLTKLSVVPAGGTQDGTHHVMSNIAIAANDDVTLDELIGVHLGPGDSIYAQAGTGAALDIVISGLESN